MKKLKALGPGIVFASLVIGETHLALQAYVGARFGMTLLWLVVLVHLIYYPIFEYGSRYAAATGESLIEGYWRLKYKKPLFWYFIFFMFITPPLFMGSLVGLTGSALSAAFPFLSFTAWCVIAFLVTVFLIIAGKYRYLEIISKFIVLLLILITLLAVVLSPPDINDALSGLIPEIPASAGVWLVVLCILRVPSDPVASLLLSEWAKEKRKDWGDDTQTLLNAVNKSVVDIRIGMAVSLLVACSFMALGAVVFQPRGIVPEGLDVVLKLSEIFTTTYGQWIFPVFILAAFLAFWGGYLSAQDGIHRLFKQVVGYLFNLKGTSRNRAGDAYLIFVAGAGLVMATTIRQPMFMVFLALSMAFLYFPLIVGLNMYCVTKMIDPVFRPGRLSLALASAGLIAGIAGLVLLILVRGLKVLG